MQPIENHRKHTGPGKGDANNRVTNWETYRREYDRIFRVKPVKKQKAKNNTK